MVRIRLRRVGAKKQPSYRVVAADKESPRDGRFLEVLGFYNPRTEPSTINFTEDRVYHWLSVGAQPSDSVRRLFDQAGLWDRYQRFKDGEDVEKLLEEAAAAEEARDVDPRTRRNDLIGQPKKVAKPADEVEEVEEAEEAEVADEADEAEETEEVEEPEEAPEADETEEAEEPEEAPEEPEAAEEAAEADDAVQAEETEEVPEAEDAEEPKE
ncbi:MAG: 30S ribosomal protein S16 [Chloroflexi bacterium]|nr:30S ribosomal protein S16 [Chloroflexota bacterium]